MKTYLKLAITAGLALILAGSAQAQVSGKGGPVQVSADHTEMDQNSRTQTFDGRVEVIQDDARLRADHVKILRLAGPNGNGVGDIDTIEATGNVYYVTKTVDGQQNTAKGDQAVYTKASDTMVMTGDVILQQGQNVFTGNRLVSQVSEGLTTFDASPTSANHGRVKAVIYPDKADSGATKPAAAKPAAPKTAH